VSDFCNYKTYHHRHVQGSLTPIQVSCVQL